MSDVTTELANEANDKTMQIARLKAENAKLREEFDKMDVWHSKELTAAMAENAKLRELVREVYALHWHGLDCTECPWFDECDTDGGCPWLSIMHDHMRELGIEVDG